MRAALQACQAQSQRLSTPAAAAAGASGGALDAWRTGGSRAAPKSEAADVGEVGDARRCRPIRLRPASPPRSTYSCSRNQRPSSSTAGTSTSVKKNTMSIEREHARAGVEQDVAAEHGGDRAGGAERGDAGVGVDSDLARRARASAAEQVEDEEAQAPDGVLDGRGRRCARNRPCCRRGAGSCACRNDGTVDGGLCQTARLRGRR